MRFLYQSILWAALTLGGGSGALAQTLSETAVGVTGVAQINPTTVEVSLANGKRLAVDFYGDNIFRVFRDDNGGIIRNPSAQPPADILVKNPRRPLGGIITADKGDAISVTTPRVELKWNKADVRSA